MLALLDLLLIGWLPTSEVLLRALEDKVAQTDLAQIKIQDVGGIMILGGAVEGGQIARDRGEVSIYSAAERVTKAFELIRKYPHLPFIYSGFSGRLSPTGKSESEGFQQLINE